MPGSKIISVSSENVLSSFWVITRFELVLEYKNNGKFLPGDLELKLLRFDLSIETCNMKISDKKLKWILQVFGFKSNFNFLHKTVSKIIFTC